MNHRKRIDILETQEGDFMRKVIIIALLIALTSLVGCKGGERQYTTVYDDLDASFVLL